MWFTRCRLWSALILGGINLAVYPALFAADDNMIRLQINPSAEVEFDNEWCSESSWETWTRATGNWNGGRTWLSEKGFRLEPTLINEISRVMSGGIDGQPRNTMRNLADLFCAWDLKNTFGWAGATVAARGQWSDGDDGSIATGDLQGWSNLSIDPDVSQIAEFWFEQGMGKRPGNSNSYVSRIKIGKVDANTEYNNIPIAKHFLNTAVHYAPTIYGFPTFPNPAMGLHLGINPNAWLSMTAGVMDGSGATGHATGQAGVTSFFEHGFDEYKLYMGQIRGEWLADSNYGSGLFQMGAWYHSGPVNQLDGGIADGTAGLFAQGQVELWKGQDGRAMTLFAQWDYADDDINRIAQHQALGLYWTGISWRRMDGAGLHVTNATLSQAPSLGYDKEHETAVEAVYNCRVSGWWLLTGDVQYIINPGGAAQHGNSWVVALRSELTL